MSKVTKCVCVALFVVVSVLGAKCDAAFPDCVVECKSIEDERINPTTCYYYYETATARAISNLNPPGGATNCFGNEIQIHYYRDCDCVDACLNGTFYKEGVRGDCEMMLEGTRSYCECDTGT